MNKLVIIGNGFDLAHGLKTRYSDFILWYLNEAIVALNTKLFYNDGLIKLLTGNNPKKIDFFKSIYDFKKAYKMEQFEIDYQHDFINNLINNLGNLNWVDIESEYYKLLIDYYKDIENGEFAISGLNDSFEIIKTELQQYLSTVEIKLEPNENVQRKMNKDIQNHLMKIKDNVNKSEPNNILFLNFNYTSTIELYKTLFDENQFRVNYIHGKLNNESNPIIFGYGDEIDSYHEKIEQLNNNDFLKNFKSFGYSMTRNYQDLFKFLGMGNRKLKYEVHIMGHSCGLSDRVLLNGIFEHENCEKIKIYYHQKDEFSNDYVEKRMDISRHFKAESKGKMRLIIDSFPDSKPLTSS
ncbi:MAG TPA: hypothetical protein DDX39_04230 [Bacteroidales bacterium]|nr:hypothetical protein [Bacteroidales bacterium]